MNDRKQGGSDDRSGGQGRSGGVQGEGDYESARRYRERTENFVESQGDTARVPPASPAEERDLDAARQEARRHAKADDQDRRDADVMRADERSRGGPADTTKMPPD